MVLAAALVCLTNLGAMGMSALNRTSVDSALTLTQRELSVARPGDSMTLLRIVWVQPSPSWFGPEHAARAGFDTSVAPSAPAADRHYQRQLQRNVYVVLEYDGPAWISYRDAVLKREPTNVGAFSGPEVADQRVTRQLAIEAHTRLLAVDIDADPARLRGKYPEASQYLIARARAAVDVTPERNTRRMITVRVLELMPSELNVPRPFSETVRELTRADTPGHPSASASLPRFTVDVKYGRFYQPWISDVRSSR
jgi:hypothetical protein